MSTVLILVVFVVGALVLVLLAIVVVAIRQEPRETEMRTVAPSPIAAVVRRMLGVYLRRPTLPTDSREEWPTTAWSATSHPPSERR